MPLAWMLTPPHTVPPLDPDFKPPILAHRTFSQAITAFGGGVPLVIGLERVTEAYPAMKPVFSLKTTRGRSQTCFMRNGF